MAGLLGKLASIFKRRPSGGVHEDTASGYKVEPIEASRFGAVTNRINREHWTHAHNNSINNDIQQRLPALQARAAYEYGTNPDFEGVINTFKDDVIGRDGPMLQVMSDDEQFNTAVEQGWREVFADPDPSHRYGGVEDMRTWIHSLLTAGPYYNVLMPTRRQNSRMRFGWRSIHARRFTTPAQHAGDPQVAFGCRYDEETGAPVEYYIQRPRRYGGAQALTGEFDTVPAAAVQHVFIPVEPEQLEGYPMMASTLDTAADLRDLDKFVLESMKNAAANSPYLQNMNPTAAIEADPIPDGSVRYEPGEVAIAPPGWQWSAPTATQPSAQYLPFKHEKAAELGRPIHMPLLVVLLTAAEANFASAQYEGTVYGDGVAVVQGVCERRSLIPFVTGGVIPEVAFRRRLTIPKRFELVWTWNVPAHANIEKFVKAIRMMIEDGVISQAQGSALLGYDWEKVVASRKKCADILSQNDLPAAPVNSGNAAQVADEPDDDPPNQEGRQSVHRFSIA